MRTTKVLIYDGMSVQDPVASNLTDTVADRLSRFISENQMEAGETLPSEDMLSGIFSVSKRVVREALRTLAAQGIVKTSQGKRAVVADAEPVALEAYFKYMQRLDRSSALELYELREIIEVKATVLAAKRATPEDLERAHRALETMENAGDDIESYVAGDLSFHTAIIDAAHNRFLSAVVAALSGALLEEREMGVRNRVRSGASPRAISEHRAILVALEAQDAELAEQSIISHLESGLVDFRPTIPVDSIRKESIPAGSRTGPRKARSKPEDL